MKRLKSNDSEESFTEVNHDVKLLEFAEKLREVIEKDPKKAINSLVVGAKLSSAFTMKAQM